MHDRKARGWKTRGEKQGTALSREMTESNSRPASATAGLGVVFESHPWLMVLTVL